MKKILFLGTILVAFLYAGQVNLDSCYGCHGQKFEKRALGKSLVVKDLNRTQIFKALKGYKNGTYGGSMKGLMKGQISKYSEVELNDISSTIKGQK